MSRKSPGRPFFKPAFAWVTMGLIILHAATALAQSHQLSQVNRYKAMNPVIEQALKEVRSGRFDKAKATLKPCLESIPDHFEAHYFMALMEYDARNFAGVLAHLDISERSLGGLEQDYRQQVSEMKARTEGAEREAQDNLGAALSRDPSGLRATKLAGLQQDLKIAEGQNNPLVTLDNPFGFPADYSFLRGNAFLRLGRRDDAMNAYRKAVATDAGHANAWNNLIALSLGSKDMASARMDLAKAEAAGVTIRPELKKAVREAP